MLDAPETSLSAGALRALRRSFSFKFKALGAPPGAAEAHMETGADPDRAYVRCKVFPRRRRPLRLGAL